MGRSKMMGAGNACHTMYTNTSKPSGGGNKKQGLVPYVGLSDHANRARLIGANGSATGRQSVTVQNQLSGVSSSEFRRAYARADGVHRVGAVPVPVPVVVSGRERITALTDRFFASVAAKNPTTPEVTASLFCSYGMLLGTVSTETRTGEDIYKYFVYFNNLPYLAANNITYTISQIPDSDVWINNVAATFTYGSPTVTTNVRMQFTYDGDCIYELYSAKLPSPSEALFQSSGKY
jgi:hypothetical protein